MFSEWLAWKLYRLLAMWNPYRKSDLEDKTTQKRKVVGNGNLHFYTAYRWTPRASELMPQASFNTTIYRTGTTKGLSQMRTPVKVSQTFCPLFFFCRLQRNMLRRKQVLRQAATHLRGVIRYAWFRGKCCASATTQHLKRALPGTYVFFAIFLAFMVKYLSEKQMILGSASLDLTAYISKREICR